jgi:hypothetical protein
LETRLQPLDMYRKAQFNTRRVIAYCGCPPNTLLPILLMIKSYNKKLNAVINSFALLSISFPPILVLKLTSNLCALETAAILMTQELDDFLKIAHNLEGLNICPEAPNCPL